MNPETQRAELLSFAEAVFNPSTLPRYFHTMTAALATGAFFVTAIAGQILLIGACLYPRLLPALGDLDRSLTIYNAASTPRTLTVMLVIALIGMPLVIGYTVFICRVFKGRVVLDESSY